VPDKLTAGGRELVRLERKRIKRKRKRMKEKIKKEQEVELRRKLRMNPQFPLKLEGSGLQCTLCQTGVITDWKSALYHIWGSKHKKIEDLLAGTKKMKESDEVNFKRKYEEDVGLKSYSKIKKLKDRSIGQVASGTVMNEVIPNSHIKKETDEYYEAHTSLMAIKEESLDIAEEKKEMKMKIKDTMMNHKTMRMLLLRIFTIKMMVMKIKIQIMGEIFKETRRKGRTYETAESSINQSRSISYIAKDN